MNARRGREGGGKGPDGQEEGQQAPAVLVVGTHTRPNTKFYVLSPCVFACPVFLGKL